MVSAIQRIDFQGRMSGYELDERSAASARELIHRSGLSGRYDVRHGDFFAALRPGEKLRCVVANPPYLPHPRERPAFPHLSGGHSGAGISKRILSSGFDTVLLMISSYADPCSVLAHARACGYTLTSWMVLPLRMGEFSRRPHVRRRIDAMSRAGTAFVAGERYLLAGGVWDRTGSGDQSAVLSRVMSRFGAAGRRPVS
ncbi:SAM-dependent methyltransferase [Herbidospora yilanensis]|uniref:SAM-dependent methyltransferase n=1 Tax=Herbidospora yilanensis TaxID=354426 RepID=UPI000781B22A|nr:SAM-dependent methyltransferase [Herbidospora yilanensis]